MRLKFTVTNDEHLNYKITEEIYPSWWKFAILADDMTLLNLFSIEKYGISAFNLDINPTMA